MNKDNTKPPDKIINNKKELIIVLCSTVICALIGLIIGLTRYSKCEVLGIIFLIAMFAFCGLGVGIIIINQHKKH